MNRPGAAPPIGEPLGNTTTERLDLRRFAAGDLDELATVFAHPEIWEFPFGRAFTRDETAAFLRQQIAEWDLRGFGCWVARTRVGPDPGRIGPPAGTMIGYLGVSVPTFLPEILPAVEVGWRLAPWAWGRGLASEGALAALHEAFTTLGLDSVCSVPQKGNPASARVAERIGMQYQREVAIPANERRGELVGLLYELDRGTWEREAVGAGSARRAGRQS